MSISQYAEDGQRGLCNHSKYWAKKSGQIASVLELSFVRSVQADRGQTKKQGS